MTRWGPQGILRGLVEAKKCEHTRSGLVKEFTPGFSTYLHQGTCRRALAHYSYDQLLLVNAQTHADTSREVAARAGDNDQGCVRIDVFREALESSKVVQLDYTVGLDNRPARHRTRPECNVGLGRNGDQEKRDKNGDQPGHDYR